jgi:dipeptidase D
MTQDIEALQPKVLWKNFKKLTQIPRPSKHEARVIEFLVSFAKEHNLSYNKDEVGNVVICKPATAGMENRKKLILQAHVDMVPQKNTEKTHDFENDPIEAYVDGDWVKARGTTLGADNGIGVASILAIMQSNDLKHGPIEGLFTIDEETGMTGAFNLKPNFITGEVLLNLDSEDDDELCIGCAGGLDTSLCASYKNEKVFEGCLAFNINLTGLRGGHSGVDIHLGRGNANKLMGRLLWRVSQQMDVRIATFSGGNLRNAIPREAFAAVIILNKHKELFFSLINSCFQVVKGEFATVDPELKLSVDSVEMPEFVMDSSSQKKFLNVLYALPNGVAAMSTDFAGVVETSSNLAIVNVDNEKIQMHCLLRSASETAKEHLANQFTAVAGLSEYSVAHSGGYPGWKPSPDSPILKLMHETYKQMFGKEPHIRVIHAGLECGIIGSTFEGLDMISFGPTIKYPHSPDEKVQISSVQSYWNFLIKILETA